MSLVLSHQHNLVILHGSLGNQYNLKLLEARRGLWIDQIINKSLILKYKTACPFSHFQGCIVSSLVLDAVKILDHKRIPHLTLKYNMICQIGSNVSHI